MGARARQRIKPASERLPQREREREGEGEGEGEEEEEEEEEEARKIT